MSNKIHVTTLQKEKISGIELFPSKLISEGTKLDTECEKFKRFVQKRYNLKFESDKKLHRWSVENFENFWDSAWKYFDIITSKPYEKVYQKIGPGFLDNDWFSGALFNFAENLLRFRDDTIALMYEDEEGNKDSVTFANMYKEVQLYAAAFRKHGLNKGDRVACYISNRKEAIFGMLATLSIGAVWGAAISYLGARAITNIVSRIEPKFLIASDRFQYNGVEVDVLNNLPMIVEGTPTLEKVIIVVTKDTTLTKNILHIKNSCFLSDFLESGKEPDQTIPELVFEQLPSSHPVFISFTSGTSGIAKGPVHPAHILPHCLITDVFVFNLKRGDVMFCNFPMGWTSILVFLAGLSVGVAMFLYNGNSKFVKDGRNIWNIIADSKASSVYKDPNDLKIIFKSEIFPDAGTTFENLKLMALSGSPVYHQNYEEVYKYISKDICIGNIYGSTECFGAITGFYLKSPSYIGEIQYPSLGLDVRCYDKEGKSVIGEFGTIVITKPAPCLPSCLWKDTDGRIMKSTYLSQFPGVWCQNDIGYINPKTDGLIPKGRSDDDFIQTGDRFGAADIYFAIHGMEEIDDSICVAQNRADGDQIVVLFIKMKKGYEFTPALKKDVEKTIERELLKTCVPQVILETKDVPYNANNKKIESIIRKILAANEIPDEIEKMNIRNPDCLKYYLDIPEICSNYQP